MTDFLFYLFSVLVLVGGLMTVLSRNPINSAMFMIVALLGTAAFFVLLESYFVAVLQVLVYAGAVMVLFVFIIMLLNVEKVRIMPGRVTLFASFVGLLLLMFGVGYLFLGNSEMTNVPLPDVVASPTEEAPFAFTTSAKSFGFGLFTKYMLPIQVAGFLLLISMVGVVVISKRFDKESEQKEGES